MQHPAAVARVDVVDVDGQLALPPSEEHLEQRQPDGWRERRATARRGPRSCPRTAGRGGAAAPSTQACMRGGAPTSRTIGIGASSSGARRRLPPAGGGGATPAPLSAASAATAAARHAARASYCEASCGYTLSSAATSANAARSSAVAVAAPPRRGPARRTAAFPVATAPVSPCAPAAPASSSCSAASTPAARAAACTAAAVDAVAGGGGGAVEVWVETSTRQGKGKPCIAPHGRCLSQALERPQAPAGVQSYVGAADHSVLHSVPRPRWSRAAHCRRSASSGAPAMQPRRQVQFRASRRGAARRRRSRRRRRRRIRAAAGWVRAWSPRTARSSRRWSAGSTASARPPLCGRVRRHAEPLPARLAAELEFEAQKGQEVLLAMPSAPTTGPPPTPCPAASAAGRARRGTPAPSCWWWASRLFVERSAARRGGVVVGNAPADDDVVRGEGELAAKYDGVVDYAARLRAAGAAVRHGDAQRLKRRLWRPAAV